MKIGNLLSGDMRENLIKGRSLESVGSVVNCQGGHSRTPESQCKTRCHNLEKNIHPIDGFIIPSQQSLRGYSNAAVRGWLGEWVGLWVSAWVRNALPCGHDSHYSFCLITFKLHMYISHDERRNPIDFGSRGRGTLLILGLGVKGQGQLWHSVYKTLWTQ